MKAEWVKCHELYGIKGSREVKETKTRKFLWTDSTDEVVVTWMYKRDVSVDDAIGKQTGEGSADCEKRGDQ